MDQPDETRIDAALEAASASFWQAFADQFPEITTGDLDPLNAMAFDEGVTRAAREWLRVNWPSRTGGVARAESHA